MEQEETQFPMKIMLIEESERTMICETPLDIPEGPVFRVIATNVGV